MPRKHDTHDKGAGWNMNRDSFDRKPSCQTSSKALEMSVITSEADQDYEKTHWKSTLAVTQQTFALEGRTRLGRSNEFKTFEITNVRLMG